MRLHLAGRAQLLDELLHLPVDRLGVPFVTDCERPQRLRDRHVRLLADLLCGSAVDEIDADGPGPRRMQAGQCRLHGFRLDEQAAEPGVGGVAEQERGHRRGEHRDQRAIGGEEAAADDR